MSSYTCIWAAALETHNGLPVARGKVGHKCSFRPMQLPLSRIISSLRYEVASLLAPLKRSPPNSMWRIER